MKYLATADSLVLDELVKWEIEADSPEEAWDKAYGIAMDCSYADAGALEIRPLNEDKQKICDKLLEVFQLTTNLYDVVDLKYDAATERVEALFENGSTKIANVAMDSGTSMIRDIIKAII